MRKAELEIAHEKALRTLDAIDVQLYRVYPTEAEPMGQAEKVGALIDSYRGARQKIVVIQAQLRDLRDGLPDKSAEMVAEIAEHLAQLGASVLGYGPVNLQVRDLVEEYQRTVTALIKLRCENDRTEYRMQEAMAEIERLKARREQK